MHATRRFVAIVYLAAALAGNPIAARAQDTAELERAVIAELEATKTPGAAVAVVSGDRVVFAKSFGVASIESGGPVTPDMLFRLGSTTKMFTGLALALLAEQGKIRLDAPISTYVTGLDPAIGRVTTAQLLSHTAGMRDFAAPVVSNDEASLGTAVRRLKADALFAEPGAIHSYSSPGYWLAGLVLESATGKSYADAMDELVFAPLGMKRTTLRPLVAMTYPVSVGHALAEGKGPQAVRPAYNNTVQWPAGSMYSSVDELARFAIAFLNSGRIEGGQALPARALERIAAPEARMPGGEAETFYGFGLMGFRDRGARIRMHGGFSRGYGSMLVLVPEQRVAVIVVSNVSGQTLPRTREKAMELFVKREPEAAPAPRIFAPLGADEAKRYAGVFAQGEMRWEVTARDGKLFMRTEGAESEMRRVAEHEFTFGAAGEEGVVFVPDANGRFEYVFFGLYAARRVP